MSSVVAELERIVEAACAAPTNVFGYGIWTHHITQVANHGRCFAELRGADAEVVVIAALLHDYASIRDAALYHEHHVHGPLEAERLLLALAYPPAKIDAVKQCIASHRASIPIAPASLEAQCLADADAMAHIEQVPSLLYLAFVRQGMDIPSGTRWVRAKLERSWRKMSRSAQTMMRAQYLAALQTLTVFEEPTPADWVVRERAPVLAEAA